MIAAPRQATLAGLLAMATRKLTFVVAGVQKGGTCTLDGLLRLHPGVQMASVKETHFFDDEEHNWKHPDYRTLDAFYQEDDDRIRGEATPITVYWRPAVQRLCEYNADIKLVLLLRNPVTRAFSNWRKEFSIYRDTLHFHEAIHEGCERVRTSSSPPGLHRVFSYVDRGRYGEQLAFLLRHFPKHNIHCEISEEFFRDRTPALERIAKFLGTTPFPDDLPALHLNPGRKFDYPSRLTPNDIAYLKELYRQDIAAVEAFVGRSIPDWALL